MKNNIIVYNIIDVIWLVNNNASDFDYKVHSCNLVLYG